MTFSVDLDLWSTQKGPVQDAATRAGTGGGRGKDFASSLLGVSADSIPETGRSLFAGPADAQISLNAVNLVAPGSLSAAEILSDPAASAGLMDALAKSTAPARGLTESDAGDTTAESSLPADEADPERAAISVATDNIESAPNNPEDAETAQPPAGQPLPTLSAEVTDAAAVSQEELTADTSALEVETEKPAVSHELSARIEPTEGELEPDSGDPEVTEAALLVVNAAPTATATPQPGAETSTPSEALAAVTAQVSKPTQAAGSKSNNGQLVFEVAGPPAGDEPANETASAEAGLSAAAGKATTHAKAPASNDNSAATSDELSPPLPDTRDAGEAAIATAATSETGSSQVGVTTSSDAVTSVSSGSTPSLFGPGAGHSPITAQAPLSQPALQVVPTHTVMVATANELPGIVARASTEAQDDRVVVQLDPPELGRVSIDFKFDAQGLQHVTITAETPEAMRQLRQMHFELTQALERNGLSGQSMSFQHQNPQQDNSWGQQTRMAGAKFDTPVLSGNGLVIAADSGPGRLAASGGRLDIKL